MDLRGRLRLSPRSRWAVALAMAVAFGLVSGLAAPRGPTTSTDAIVSMVSAFAIGLVSGALTGRRWSLLVMPAVSILALELTRLGAAGPTVDGIRLGSMYGVIAFVVGRGFHFLVAVVPMVLGGVCGIVLSSSSGHGDLPRRQALAWSLTGLLGASVLGVAVLLAIPASTAPILGADGALLPGSIAELAAVPIGGHEQVMLIRGRSVDAPVLLYLAGGPGGTDIGAMRRDTGLEEAFIVATWDQRGAGKSYPALEPADTLTLEGMIRDTIEVTDYLRERFDEDKIYLVGNSWGTSLGVLAAQRRPELYHAYVGTGQMVSQRATDIMFWEDTLAWAVDTGETDLADTLLDNGQPPYEDLLDYEPALSHEHDWNAYPELDVGNEMPGILFVPEYDWMDRINGFRSFLDTFSVLYPQLQHIDLRTDVTSLDVPVYMVLGEHEARGRATLADEWFEMLDAPLKERIIFEGTGHRPHFEQPGRFADFMVRVMSDTIGVHERIRP